MKTNRIIIAALVAIVTLTFTGCGTAGGILAKHQEAAIVNVPVKVAVTNDAGIVETNVVIVPTVVSNDVYTVAPKVEQYAATAHGAVEAAGNFLPVVKPYASVVDSALGIGLALVSAFAWVKTRLARKNESKLQLAGTMLRAVVSGVEAAGDSKVKALIAQHANVADIATELHATVQAVTSSMQNAPAPKAS